MGRHVFQDVTDEGTLRQWFTALVANAATLRSEADSLLRPGQAGRALALSVLALEETVKAAHLAELDEEHRTSGTPFVVGVTFDWRYHEIRHPDGRRDENRYAPQIRVEYETRQNPGGGVGMPVVEVMWTPDQAPLDFLMSLRAEMVKKGFGLEANLVSPDLLAHLGVAVADAVAGRRVEDGAWVEGALAEWLADGWAITEAGLISRDHGSISADGFPENELHGDLIPFDPPAPEGVSEAFWKFAVDRTYARHGRGPISLGAVAYMGSRQQPVFTTQTSPRKHPDWPY